MYQTFLKNGVTMQAFYENKQEKIYFTNEKNRILECNAHLHYHIEIALIFSGKTEVTVNNTTEIASAGDAILVFPNQIHTFKTLEAENHALIIFDPYMFPEFSSIYTDRIPQNNIIHNVANNGEICELFKNISRLYHEENAPYRENMLKGYILAFLGKLFSMVKFKKIASEDMHAIGAIINYCLSNHNKNLSLDILEEALHINKYYISHVINQKLHMSFNDYVNSIRVSNACKYLAESKMSVLDISEKVGFNTVRTFNRAFIKNMGISPRDYRKKSGTQGA